MARRKRLHNSLIHEFVHFIYNSQVVQAFDCMRTQVSCAEESQTERARERKSNEIAFALMLLAINTHRGRREDLTTCCNLYLILYS